MDESLKKYIIKLSDKEKTELINILASSSPAAEEALITYCIKKFPEAKAELKIKTVRKLFSAMVVDLDDFIEESEYCEYDYDDEAIDEIYDSIEALCVAISEDDTPLPEELRNEIYEYIIDNLEAAEDYFDEVLLSLAWLVCYTKEAELVLAEEIRKQEIYNGYDIACKIYEKYGDTLAMLELRKRKAHSTFEIYSLIEDYEEHGYRKEAVELALELLHNGMNKSYWVGNCADRFCLYVYNYFTGKDDIDGLIALYKKDIPDKLAVLILKEAKKKRNTELVIQILSDLISEGEPTASGKYFSELKQLSPARAENLFKEMSAKPSEQLIEVCFEEERYADVSAAINSFASDRFSRYSPIGNQYDLYAERLKEFLPDKASEYFFKRAELFTNLMGKENYKTAVEYLKKSKAISNEANLKGWYTDFGLYLDKHRAKRNLMPLIIENKLNE